MTDILRVRGEVFGKELGMPEAAAESPDDLLSVHAVALNENDEVVAVGTLGFDGARFEISKIAVLKDYRGQYYGDFIVKLLIDKAALGGAKEIYGLTVEGTEGFMKTVRFETAGEAYEAEGKKIIPMKISEENLANRSCGGCH